jgi:membrane associated rhomboid family serine protease
MDAPALSLKAPPARSSADVRMRRLLRVPDEGPRGSARSAENAFSTSVVVSGLRCLLTYLILPAVGPVVGLSGGVGPVIGLIAGTVSFVAIVASMRRFFRADHRWRWRYAAVGGIILLFLVVQAVIDVVHLVP